MQTMNTEVDVAEKPAAVLMAEPPALGAKVSDSLPAGFFPLGFNPAPKDLLADDGIPQTRDELGELLVYTYDVTVTAATELNIPVVGSVGGGLNRRVVVYEWTRYKPIVDEEGIEYRYGYVIRFCLTVNRWDANTKLSLPFLSAQAELGNIQASWMMQIRGLSGAKIDSVVLPPQELDVETFVIAQQSLKAAIAAANDAETNFIPGTVVAKIDTQAPERGYWQSAVKAFAVYNLSRGRTRAQAIERLGSGDAAATDLIVEAYEFFGIASPTEKPSQAARQRARTVLGGIEADT